MLDRCRMLFAVAATAVLMIAVSTFAEGSAKRSQDRMSTADAASSAQPRAAERPGRPRLRAQTRRFRRHKVDRVAPDTVIGSGPAGTISARSAEFTFSSSEAGSRFECKLDSAAWTPCSSPATHSGLGDGSHVFSVRAVDAAGNVDASPATRSFSVSAGGDASPPETTISSGPAGTIASPSASFGFSSSESGSTFECKLDAGAWAACTSPKAYSNLTEGGHSFSVRARDAAGNTDTSPAVRGFAVDLPDPATPGAIPGTGAVLKQDLGTTADPVPLWKKIESAFAPQNATNPQVLYRTAGGDPRPAIGQAAPSPGYRRLFTTDGMQSLYDADVGNDSQRTQLISNSDTNTFFPLQHGERYVIYFSVRFEEESSLPGDGLSQNSQVWQIKNTGTGPKGTRRMIIAMQEARNELHFTRAVDRNTAVLMRRSGFARGEWLRFALDVKFSADPSQGKVQLWGELTGDPNAPLQPLTEMITTQTAYDDQAVGKLSIGPYHGMDLGGVSRDYTNIQVTDWVAP